MSDFLLPDLGEGVTEADIRAVQGVATVTVPELRVWKVLVLDFSTE